MYRNTECNNIGWLIYISAFIVAIFIVLVAVQSSKKFVLDEVDFPLVSKATSETWKPIYYRGESNPHHLGIYHPPLYIYAQAVFIRMFGFSETVIRMFGMCCVLLTALLTLHISRLIVPSLPRYFDSVFCALFLLNPYTIASATLPDIDSTVLPVTMTLFILLLLHTAERNREIMERSRLMELGVAMALPITLMAGSFALCLWSKLTTPLLLPPFAFLLLNVQGIRRLRALIVVGFVSVLGAFVFVLTYWIYCAALGLPMEYTYSFLLQSFDKGSSASGVARRLLRLLYNAHYTGQFLHWITLPTAAVLASAGADALIACVRERRESPAVATGRCSVAVLFMFGSAVTVGYLFITGPFDRFLKYPFAAYQFLMLPAAFLLARALGAMRARYLALIGIGVLLAAGVSSHVWGDSFLKQHRSLNTVEIIVFIAVSAGIASVWIMPRMRRFAAVTAALLLICACGFQLGVSRVQAVSTYPTKYYYGQTGLDETVTYLKGKTKPDEVIFSMKDVGYYVNNRYEENFGYLVSTELQKHLEDIMRSGSIRYYVGTEGIGVDQVEQLPGIIAVIRSYAVLERRFGNFVIYALRDDIRQKE